MYEYIFFLIDVYKNISRFLFISFISNILVVSVRTYTTQRKIPVRGDQVSVYALGSMITNLTRFYIFFNLERNPVLFMAQCRSITKPRHG